MSKTISSHLRKGYGSMLMAEISKANGISTIEVDYWINNKGEERFYEKHDDVVYRALVYKQI